MESKIKRCTKIGPVQFKHLVKMSEIYKHLPLDLQLYIEELYYRDHFKTMVLPHLKPVSMCDMCEVHTPPCIFCAIDIHWGKYGPGNVNGTPTMIMQDSTYYDGYIYNEIYKWIDRTGRTPKVIY